MKCDSIVFDLDGTLWSAAASTAAAWTRVFSKWGLEEVLPRHIEAVAGRPYLECLKIILGTRATMAQNTQLLAELEKAEQEELITQGAQLYPKVEDTLELLKGKKRLFVVSNCKDWYLDAFLDYKNLGRYFEAATCFGKTGLVKHLNLVGLQKEYKLIQPIYVGDTESDMKSALLASYDYIHVNYGFEPAVQAEKRINTIDELVRHIALDRMSL